MQVILLERVGKLGKMGDVVSVKDGYARNFLIPQHKALRANNENKAVFDARRAELEKHSQAAKGEAEKLLSKVDGVSVTLIRQAGEDGRLFGSVATRDIVDGLKEKGVSVERRAVLLTSVIKNTGSYKVKLALHPEVTATITLLVARTEGDAALQANPELAEEQKELLEEADLVRKGKKKVSKKKADEAGEEDAAAEAE